MYIRPAWISTAQGGTPRLPPICLPKSSLIVLERGMKGLWHSSFSSFICTRKRIRVHQLPPPRSPSIPSSLSPRGKVEKKVEKDTFFHSNKIPLNMSFVELKTPVTGPYKQPTGL